MNEMATHDLPDLRGPFDPSSLDKGRKVIESITAALGILIP